MEDTLQVSGSVSLQGVPTDIASQFITVEGIPAVGISSSVHVNTDGSVDLSLLNGLYSFIASAPGFLSARTGDVDLIHTGATLPNVELKPGDINGDNVIDSVDAHLLSAVYGTASDPDTQVLDEFADLDFDGFVTGRDASLFGTNFGATGLIPWLAESDPQPQPTPTPVATATPSPVPTVGPPPAPDLQETNGAVSLSVPVFNWTDTPNTDSATYQIQIDDEPDFSSPEIDESTSTSDYRVPDSQSLAPGDYFWRVRAFNEGQPGPFSDPRLQTVITESQRFIYFAQISSGNGNTDGAIRRIDRISRKIDTILSFPDVGDPRAVAISNSLEKLYWSDVSNLAIRRSNLDGFRC